MSTRDRAPQPKRSSHITPEGAKKLRAELDHLWTVERPRVTQEVADAAAQGDRSENAEYIYGKRRLREIDRRVRFLSKRLDEVTVVSEPPSDPRRVFFGAYVTVEDEDGDEKTYRIVGADESDLEQGYISIDSPVARALLGKREGDEVTVRVPKGDVAYAVTGVRYGSERKTKSERTGAGGAASDAPESERK
ncbi:MAG TPA: transcription elongation factor GreB [Kofleriaceae bacterium]|nr:transcription elongation factor GreB [Kofleriaceae bacterium]